MEAKENSYIENLKKRYPLHMLEKHIQTIENLGYEVSMTNDGFQIWNGTKLIIDSDYFSDYYLNAIAGIDTFYE